MNLIVNVEETINEELISKYTKYLEDYFSEQRDYSLVFVDNEYIRNLNNEFRQKDTPTDVLTFVESTKTYLGDIIISYDKVKSQSQEYRHSLERELLFLITHGFLHLLGYDHINKEDEEEMFTLQEELLKNYRG